MAWYYIARSLRTDKKKRNGKCPIIFRVTINKEETKVPTGLEIEESKWDRKKMRPRDNDIDSLLTRKEAELQTFLNKLANEIGDENVTIDNVKDFRTGKRAVKPENKSFYEYFNDFLERRIKEGLAKGTVGVYNVTRHSLEGFKPEFRIKDITLKIVEDFDDYLKNVRGNEDGGREPRHKNLKTIILDMKKRGLDIKNPYEIFVIPRSKAKEVYLDDKELIAFQKLSGKYFKKQPTKYDTLSMYLFACYTGLRISDILDLRWEHIDFENNTIRKTMIKTRKEVIAPFPADGRAKGIALILSKSKTLIGTSEHVFPRYEPQTINRTLKEIAADAGVEKVISFHCARHTFATQLVMSGIPIYDIQRFLGHRSFRETERYLKYDLNLASDMVRKYDIFSVRTKKE